MNSICQVTASEHLTSVSKAFILSRFLALKFFFFFFDEPKETFLDVGLRPA